MTETADRREEKRPVWRYQIDQMSWANGVTAAETANLPISGIVYAFATVVNDNTGNRTVTVAITDEDSYELYSLAGIAENATTVTRLTAGTEIYVPAGCNVSVTPSGDPGLSGMTCTVTFYGI